MAGQRRRVRGDRAIGKILRRLPEGMKAELGQLMDAAGDELLAAQRADVPRKTGAVARALSKRLSKSGLKLRVGLIGKPINRRLFYAHILEKGRKAQNKQVDRRTPSGGRTRYLMRVSALPPRPFVWKGRADLRRSIGKRIAAFWERTLQRASQGISDD